MRFAFPQFVTAMAALAGCHAAPLPATPASGRMPDARVASVALVANNVEQGYATLAATRASDPDVRVYAERMRTDHGAMNAMLGELLAGADLVPEDDAAGLALRDSSAARRDRLAAARAGAVDMLYVDTDLRSHRELLRLLDDLLLPSATRPALREYVAALRPVVTAHIAHAEQLRATLASRRQ